MLTLVSDQYVNDPSAVAQLLHVRRRLGRRRRANDDAHAPQPRRARSTTVRRPSSRRIRTSGDEGILTTGSFEIQHRYLGPPNPANPTADIRITVTVVDDNNGSVSVTILVPNPGISSKMIAIDTTPQVPRLEFIPIADDRRLPGSDRRHGAEPADLEPAWPAAIRISPRMSISNCASYSPTATRARGNRLPEDALQNLREIFATLPDNHYRIYLVRTENKSRRLVMEVSCGAAA